MERLRRVNTQLDAIADVVIGSPNGQKKCTEESAIWDAGGRGSESLDVNVSTPQQVAEDIQLSSSLRRSTEDDEAAKLQRSASGYITASEEMSDSDSESQRTRHSEYTTPKSALK